MAPDAPAAPIVVVGAGWAGLAAAVELTASGLPVTLLEAAPQAGGRARGVPFGPTRVDNGQHLLVGAYRETLRVMRRVGADPDRLFTRQPLALTVAGAGGGLRLRTSPLLPAPLHLAAALLSTAGFDLSERIGALKFGLYAALVPGRPAEDRSVRELLRGQPGTVNRLLWEPLCLATLNTPPDQASAAVFLRVLRDTFARRRADSDLLIPRVPLSAVLPDPALRYLEQQGQEVRLGQRVTGFEMADGRVAAVLTNRGRLPAAAVVLAVAPRAAARLLSGQGELADTAALIGDLDHEPITTVYLRYREARLAQPMLGLSGDTTAQWLVDRPAGQANTVAAVISAGGPHMQWSRETLVTRVQAEVTPYLGHADPPLDSLVVREHFATFACTTGCEARRPESHTAVENLYLAGDYTATGYPATLEGAVRSGVQCARDIGDNATFLRSPGHVAP